MILKIKRSFQTNEQKFIEPEHWEALKKIGSAIGGWRTKQLPNVPLL